MRSLSRSPIALAALAVASMSGLGLSAEVVPRTPPEQPLEPPLGVGGWLRRNNQVRHVKAPKKRTSQLNQRLAPATGPGSINAESQMQALVRAGKADEAAAFYEACFRIHYKHGKPKMRWGGRWYLEYKRTAGVST